MTKQHQILAVEPTRQAAAEKQLAECTNTFSKKDNLFAGQVRTAKMFDQSPERLLETQAIEAKDAINTPVQYTVPQNLNYMAGMVGQWFDVILTKEATNQVAKADIVIDGTVILKDAPATFLLGMENKLGKLRDLYNALPTLAPGHDWVPAPDKGENIWKSPTETTMKTANIVKHVQLKQSSDKHPDTFEKTTDVVNVGVYTATKYSGMVSVAEKARIISRLDRLLMAVKDARMRANDVEAVEKRCAMEMFAYLHGGMHNANEVKAAVSEK